MIKFFYTFLLVTIVSSASELETMQVACNNKVSAACHQLGLLYEKGFGMPKNIQMAKEYYIKACELNYDNACKELEYIKIEG